MRKHGSCLLEDILFALLWTFLGAQITLHMHLRHLDDQALALDDTVYLGHSLSVLAAQGR